MASLLTQGHLNIKKGNCGIKDKKDVARGNSKNTRKTAKKASGLGNRKALSNITNKSDLQHETTSKKINVHKEEAEFNIPEKYDPYSTPDIMHGGNKFIKAQEAAGGAHFFDIAPWHIDRTRRTAKKAGGLGNLKALSNIDNNLILHHDTTSKKRYVQKGEEKFNIAGDFDPYSTPDVRNHRKCKEEEEAAKAASQARFWKTEVLPWNIDHTNLSDSITSPAKYSDAKYPQAEEAEICLEPVDSSMEFLDVKSPPHSLEHRICHQFSPEARTSSISPFFSWHFSPELRMKPSP